jgi:hypothetical protein
VQKYEKGVNRMGSSRLQQAPSILGVRVPYFFEGGANAPFKSANNLSPSYVVSSENGPRLAKAFMRVPRFAVRHRIVALVQDIAGEDGG